MLKAWKIFLYENSHILWPHLPDLRFPKPPPSASGTISTADNPFASPVPKRASTLGREVARLYNAVSFLMWQHELVMNAHVIINWRLLGVDERRAAATLSQYNHEAAKWLRVGDESMPRQRMTRRASAGGSKHHWVYVHEHARDEGFHTHLLCVVPREKANAFWTWSLATLARLTRQPRVHHDAVWFVPCTKQGFAPYRARSEADAVARCWDWFRYLSKTARPTVAYKDNDGQWRAARQIFKLNYAYRETAPVHCAQLAGVSEIDRSEGTGGGRVLFKISDRRVGCPLRRVGAEGLSPTRPRGGAREGSGAGLGRHRALGLQDGASARAGPSTLVVVSQFVLP